MEQGQQQSFGFDLEHTIGSKNKTSSRRRSFPALDEERPIYDNLAEVRKANKVLSEGIVPKGNRLLTPESLVGPIKFVDDILDDYRYMYSDEGFERGESKLGGKKLYNTNRNITLAEHLAEKIIPSQHGRGLSEHIILEEITDALSRHIYNHKGKLRSKDQSVQVWMKKSREKVVKENKEIQQRCVSKASQDIENYKRVLSEIVDYGYGKTWALTDSVKDKLEEEEFVSSLFPAIKIFFSQTDSFDQLGKTINATIRHWYQTDDENQLHFAKASVLYYAECLKRLEYIQMDLQLLKVKDCIGPAFKIAFPKSTDHSEGDEVEFLEERYYT